MKGQSIAIGAYNAMLWRSVAAIVISGALFAVRRAPWPDRATLALHAKRSTAAAISVLLFFWGLVRVPMAEGIALCFLAPVFAILLAAPMLGEKIRRGAIGACLLAFAGMGVIVAAKAEAGEGSDAIDGALAIVAASLFYGYNLVQLRRSAQQAGPIEITFFTNLVFGACYALAAPALAVLPAVAHWPWLMLAAVLAIVSSLLLAWAYAHAETQQIVPVEFTAFLWAALFGALVFGERVTWPMCLGAALIVGGCLIAAQARDQAGPIGEAAA